MQRGTEAKLRQKFRDYAFGYIWAKDDICNNKIECQNSLITTTVYSLFSGMIMDAITINKTSFAAKW